MKRRKCNTRGKRMRRFPRVYLHFKFLLWVVFYSFACTLKSSIVSAFTASFSNVLKVSRFVSAKILSRRSSGMVPRSDRISSISSALPSALPSALLIRLVSCTSYASKLSNNMVNSLRSIWSVKFSTSLLGTLSRYRNTEMILPISLNRYSGVLSARFSKYSSLRKIREELI